MRTFQVASLAANLMYHDIAGEGVPIVFLHGLGCASSCDYTVVAAHEALRGRRILLVDLLGSGFSERPRDFAYTVDGQAKVVAELVAAVCPGPVDVFGHSMGGAVAIALSALLDPRVRRIALGEPNLDPGGGSFSRQVASMPEDTYVARGHDALVDSARAGGNTIWASSLARSAPFAVHRGATSLVAGCAPTWREMLGAMDARKTVIFGERSLPDDDLEWLPRHGCAVEIVANAGHSMALENPAGLAEAVRRAL